MLASVRGGLLAAALAACGFSLPCGAHAAQENVQADLPGEAMYARTSEEMWAHVQDLIKQLGFRPEKQDETNQVLVTRWRAYDARIFPDAETLGIKPGDRPVRVQLHLLVARGHQPARVAVGSVIELERTVSRRTQPVMGYRASALEAWFLAELDARSGVRHQPLVTSREARMEQARRLMPDAPVDRCLEPPSSTSLPTEPVKINHVQPLFPDQGYEAGSGKVVMAGWITEHGTLTNLRILEPSKHVYYEVSARAASSLWRFQPATLEGCPLDVPTTITVNYRAR